MGPIFFLHRKSSVKIFKNKYLSSIFKYFILHKNIILKIRLKYVFRPNLNKFFEFTKYYKVHEKILQSTNNIDTDSSQNKFEARLQNICDVNWVTRSETTTIYTSSVSKSKTYFNFEK